MVLTTATHLVNNIAALDRKTTGCDRIGLHEASFKKPHSRAMGCRELVAINGSLENWPQLVRGVRPGVETLILDPNCDGVAQITAILRQAAANDRYTTLHLVSHGEPGSLKLGNGILSRETLSGYESDLQLWQKFLGQENSFGSEILIYGCSFAAQETSRNFVRVLGKLTGAKIAASRSLVGCAARGGPLELRLPYRRNCHRCSVRQRTPADLYRNTGNLYRQQYRRYGRCESRRWDCGR